MVVGIILLILGIAGCVYGYYLNNDLEAQFFSVWEHGHANPGNIYLIAGGVVAVIGIAIIIWRLSAKRR